MTGQHIGWFAPQSVMVEGASSTWQTEVFGLLKLPEAPPSPVACEPGRPDGKDTRWSREWKLKGPEGCDPSGLPGDYDETSRRRVCSLSTPRRRTQY